MKTKLLLLCLVLLTGPQPVDAQIPEDVGIVADVARAIEPLADDPHDLAPTAREPCTPPSPARDLELQRVPAGNRLTWKAPVESGDGAVLSYKVFRIDLMDLSSGYQVFHVSGGARSWTDTDTIRPGPTLPSDLGHTTAVQGSFVYLVAAKNQCGIGGMSNPVLTLAGFNPFLMLNSQTEGPWPHCLILTVIHPVAPPYVNGPHLECLLPLPL